MKKVVLYFQGILIGMTDTIPGVSGATMAVILGVYEKLTSAASQVTHDFRAKKSIKPHLSILVPLFLGVATGIVFFAHILISLLEKHNQIMHLFFSGLVVGSLPMILTESTIKKISPAIICWFSLGVLLMVALLWMEHTYLTQNDLSLVTVNPLYLVKIMLSGLIVAVATILPGLSGSLVLLIMGEYHHSLGFIKLFFDSLKEGIIAWDSLIVLAVLALSLLTGLMLCANMISHLLTTHKQATFTFIMGLIVSSLLRLWPNPSETKPLWYLILIPAIALTWLPYLIKKILIKRSHQPL
jgi:putative membrane protein